ncbi:hypothetical protein HOY82DRAFT_636557 [Tuber indicum]|nr:hypothetical protein HOY82DRAFT_636557 [Tuber indicum]
MSRRNILQARWCNGFTITIKNTSRDVDTPAQHHEQRHESKTLKSTNPEKHSTVYKKKKDHKTNHHENQIFTNVPSTHTTRVRALSANNVPRIQPLHPVQRPAHPPPALPIPGVPARLLRALHAPHPRARDGDRRAGGEVLCVPEVRQERPRGREAQEGMAGVGGGERGGWAGEGEGEEVLRARLGRCRRYGAGFGVDGQGVEGRSA